MHFTNKTLLLLTCCLIMGCGEPKRPVPKGEKQAPSKQADCTISDLWTSDPSAYRISDYPCTDSASSATAMATGRKTVYGAISVIPGEDTPPKTIAEHMKERGAAIGVVTSVPFNHATPAGFLVHSKSRGDYGGIALEILEQFKPDVVIGGGHPNTSKGRYFSRAAWEELLSNKDGAYSEYDVIGLGNCRVNSDVFECSPMKQLDKLASTGKNKLVAVLGGQVPCDKCGAGGTYAKGFFVPSRFELAPDLTHASYDFRTPEIESKSRPQLEDTVEAALKVLERRNRDKGSFLLVEGGDVDWAGHSNDFAWMLAAMHEFEQAVKRVVRYIDSPNGYNWNNTLVIVTADHACSFLRIDKAALKELHSSGKTPSQKWVDGEGAMRNGQFDDGEWHYGEKGKSPVVYKTTDHTNELVTIAVRGRGANGLFKELEKERPCGGKSLPGLIDNTQIFTGMKRAVERLGVEHIILMIGDGMHEAHEVAYSIVRYGEEDELEWNKWSVKPGPDLYEGQVTTWDISTYDWYACQKGEARYEKDSCESRFGYDESMTPAQSVSIGSKTATSDTYFLTMPKRR